jgi:hypothetical protein
MSSTGTPRVSMQRRGLAMLVAVGLLLSASGPTLAESVTGTNISGSDVIALGAKAGIASGQNISTGSDVIALGAKLGIAGGTSVIAPVDEEISQPV